MTTPTIAVVLPSAADVEALDGADLDAVLWQLEQVRRQTEASIAAVVKRADRARRYRADGHRTVKAWAMAVTNCSHAEAVNRHRLGALMCEWPKLDTELREGRLGVAQARELSRLSANPRCGDQVAEFAEVLLNAAKDLQYADFQIVSRRWEQLADADGAFRHHDRAMQHRNVMITEIGGEYHIRGRLPALHGTVVRDIFDRFCQAEFVADTEQARAEFGEATKDRLDRTAAQRRADAFVKMVEAAATAGINGQPVAVCVNLLMDHDQFEQYLRNGIDETPVTINPAGVLDRRCETSDGVPVDPRQAVALALVGHVRRVVINAKGVIVNAGARSRLYRGQLRDMLQTLDPRCIWLGCMVRAAVSQLDHLQGYAAGGATDADNARAMCRHHNLFKHRNRYQPRRNDDGTWRLHRPDGTRIQPPDAA